MVERQRVAVIAKAAYHFTEFLIDPEFDRWPGSEAAGFDFQHRRQGSCEAGSCNAVLLDGPAVPVDQDRDDRRLLPLAWIAFFVLTEGFHHLLDQIALSIGIAPRIT